jgi:hypothetical protein
VASVGTARSLGRMVVVPRRGRLMIHASTVDVVCANRIVSCV